MAQEVEWSPIDWRVDYSIPDPLEPACCWGSLCEEVQYPVPGCVAVSVVALFCSLLSPEVS